MACEVSKERRRLLREHGQKILNENGIPFSTNNDGVHLIIPRDQFTVDYWPGTGKFNVRGTKSYGRGIYNLIDLIKQKEQKHAQNN